MKIIPNRTMSLEGQRVEHGKPTEVSESAGQFALRMGWAKPADEAVAEAEMPKAIRRARGKSEAD